MRWRKATTFGLLAAGLFALAVMGWLASHNGTLAITVGLNEYLGDRGQRQASLWLTNAGQAHLTISTEFRCQVETPSGLTNYTAGVPKGWIWLRPHQGAVLSSRAYWIPLPADARQWSLALSTRRQTAPERLASFLMTSGIIRYRDFHRHPIGRFLGPAMSGQGVDKEWEEIRSGWIEAPQEGDMPTAPKQ